MVMAKKKTEIVTEPSDDDKSIPVNIRLPKSLVGGLDEYRNSQRFPPTRQIIIERLLEDFLRQQESKGAQ